MIGKINHDFFKRAIMPHTGAKNPMVVVGPGMGVDAAVLKVGEEYMVVAEDPIFPGPTTSPDDFGWIIVHIGASDVAVMGVAPRFMTYSLLLPPGTPEDYIAELVKSISKYAAELGITVVGGHTGFYGAVTVPTIGGITVWGFGKEFVTPAGARVGDAVIITKGAAIEAAGILACELGQILLAAGMDPNLVERARKRWREMSVVADAQTAFSAGGVHAMHDATEGGLARGLWEVAHASGVGLKIYRSRVPVPEDVQAVCSYFGLDPYEAISEGTLVLTCDPARSAEILSALKDAGIEAAVIGEVIPESEGRYWVEDDGTTREIMPPAVDRFWEVFFNALTLKNDTRNPEEKRACMELKEAVDRIINLNPAHLIPEVGANLAYALPGAMETRQIAAIPGRLLRFKDRIVALGEPEMGCSRHMAGCLLAVRKFFPCARCIINLRYTPAIRKACEEMGFKVTVMPVPEGYRQEEENFERDLRRTLEGCAQMPDVIEIPDRINLERLILVLGHDLEELVGKISALAAKAGD